MQIEGLKVTDYIKTEGASDQGFGVGTSGIKDDNKANFNTELRTLSVDNAFYDNRGKMTDEDFTKEVNEASALGMSTVDKVKNIERGWDEEATAKAREDGHNPMDMEPEALVTVVDEIKMNLAKAGKDITLYGGGTIKRTFTHMEDLCYQIVEGALKKESDGQIYNVGGETLSLRQAAEIVAKKFETKVVVVPWPERDLRIESDHTYFDDTKIQALLGGMTYKRLDDFSKDI